jgi:hypothetical protein
VWRRRREELDPYTSALRTSEDDDGELCDFPVLSKTKRGMRRVRCAQQEYRPFDIPLESSALAGYFAVYFDDPPIRGGAFTCPNALNLPPSKTAQAVVQVEGMTCDS